MLTILAEVLLEILLSAVIRWLFGKIKLAGTYEKLLRKLEKYRPNREPLTMKEIVNNDIIKSVDPKVITPQIKRRIQEGLADRELVRRRWDDSLKTPLSFDWKQFFIHHRSLLSCDVVPNLNELYQNIKIACLVILPSSRNKKHKPIEGFLEAFKKCLGSQPINIEYMAPAMIQEGIKPPWLKRIKERENILILQPMAMDDDNLERTLKFISDFCMGGVYEVITVIDASGRPLTKRSVKPKERILLELDLSHV